MKLSVFFNVDPTEIDPMFAKTACVVWTSVDEGRLCNHRVGFNRFHFRKKTNEFVKSGRDLNPVPKQKFNCQICHGGLP